MSSVLSINISDIKAIANLIIEDDVDSFETLINQKIKDDQILYSLFNANTDIFFDSYNIKPNSNASITDSIIFYKATKIFTKYFDKIKNSFHFFNCYSSKNHGFYYLIHNKDFDNQYQVNVDPELLDSVIKLYNNNIKIFLDSLVFEQHLITLYEIGKDSTREVIKNTIEEEPHLCINQAIVSKSTAMLDFISNFLTTDKFKQFMSTTNNQLDIFRYAALSLNLDVFLWCFQKILGDENSDDDYDEKMGFFNSKKDFLMYCIENSKDDPTDFICELLSLDIIRNFSGYKDLMLFLDIHQNNLLHYACKRGSVQLFNSLVAAYVEIINDSPDGIIYGNSQFPITHELFSAKNEDGECPVHIAVKNKCMDILEQAYSINNEYGSDIEGVYEPDGKLQSILHMAVQANWIEGVKFILSDPQEIENHLFTKHQDKYGLSPVAWMAINGNVDMLSLIPIEILLSDTTRFTYRNLLHWAAIEHQFEVAEFLLGIEEFKKNIDVMSGEPPYTALHYAVKLEDFEMIQFLIKNGSDPNSTNPKYKVASPYKITEDKILQNVMEYEYGHK